MSTAYKVAPDTSASTDTEPRIVPVEYIERRIHLLREQKIMLDSDLADLYQVTTGQSEPSGKAKSKSLPCRLHVSAD